MRTNIVLDRLWIVNMLDHNGVTLTIGFFKVTARSVDTESSINHDGNVVAK